MPDGEGPSSEPAGQPAGHVTGEETNPNRRLRRWVERLTGRRGASAAPLVMAQQSGSGDEAVADREMVERIVAFNQKRVDDVAIPRADIVAVDIETNLSDLLQTFSSANHSRLPVYRGDLDDPLGMIHIKDFIGLLASNGLKDIEGEEGRHVVQSILRKLLYVPPSMPVTELLLRMQASRVHMALVIDEFGGTDGLLTIEDLIELIVGDIRDEHDEGDTHAIHKIADYRWEADSRVPLEELEDVIGAAFALDDHDADTMGGLVFSLAGRVPLRGEVITHPNGAEFEIIDADHRRIRRVRITEAAHTGLDGEPQAGRAANETAAAVN
ncbi:CBS domain protein [Parvularcula bermudensis HTCC2503]|uniref:CBS domain protein n=1 Tax=Parvularcula bermudensis (strain ATCC BAA-594 / HTCC2503 / KCTC 12087) TaxID=314260 RepID=E0TEP3_PARBH|nr:hemolysin family protein [Parvularcula bermudensis]ADM08926.1 CBS domain protein [Parvularcula bermudensis HTCC2503]